MKRCIRVYGHNGSTSIRLTATITTRGLARYEAERLVDAVADDLMRLASDQPFHRVPLSKVVVKT